MFAISPLVRDGNFQPFALLITHPATSGFDSVLWTWARTLPLGSTWSCSVTVPFIAGFFFLPSEKHLSTSIRCWPTTDEIVALSIAGFATAGSTTGSAFATTGSAFATGASSAFGGSVSFGGSALGGSSLT